MDSAVRGQWDGKEDEFQREMLEAGEYHNDIAGSMAMESSMYSNPLYYNLTTWSRARSVAEAEGGPSIILGKSMSTSYASGYQFAEFVTGGVFLCATVARVDASFFVE